MVRIALLFALLSACVAEESLSAVESSLACELFICGDNAPTAGDGLLFDEINLFGETNYAGVKLVDAYNGSVQLAIDIEGNRLSAREVATGAWRTDDALVGTIIKLQSSAGEQFEILIEAFNEGMVSYRAGASTEVPIYLMKYRRPALGQYKFERYACQRDVIDADWPWAGRYALVFRGERYDHTKRSVPTDPARGWSFIACAGSAAAKLHLMRHTEAGGHDPSGVYPTTLSQRTALLKAITADYCGTGTPAFTVPGNPLTFTAAAPFTMPGLAPVASYEALWSEDGALCIDVPRRHPTLVPDPTTMQWTRTSIQNACGKKIPTCGTWITFWPWFGYAITANPA